MKRYPATLVVAINAWRDNSGINTLLNLFNGWDSQKLSLIYTKSDLPQTKACRDFFQIPEQRIVQSLYRPRTQTGFHLSEGEITNPSSSVIATQKAEQKNLSYARSHRSWFLSLLRELIWLLGNWKSTEFKKYLDQDKWDVVFCPIYPLIFMNRLQSYVLQKTGVKGVAFIGDDNYSYKVGRNPLFYLHRFFLRRSVDRVIKKCEEVFVMTPKMKREYDAIWGIRSQLLTKGVDFENTNPSFRQPQHPIQIYYAGKLILGRYKSLATIAQNLSKININGTKAELHIYTQDSITEEQKRLLEIPGCSYLHKAVPYSELPHILDRAEVVVFAESLDKGSKDIARLSFSTKITDYFKAAKCILAIGSKEIAPIEYLLEKDAALVCTSYHEIGERLHQLIDSPSVIEQYARKAYACGVKYHNARDIEKKMYETLTKCARQSYYQHD